MRPFKGVCSDLYVSHLGVTLQAPDSNHPHIFVKRSSTIGASDGRLDLWPHCVQENEGERVVWPDILPLRTLRCCNRRRLIRGEESDG